MSIFQSIGNFVAKEVTGAEKTLAAIGAFLKKEEPEVQKVLDTALADYKLLSAAVPQIETDLQALATLIAEIMITIK